MKFTLFTQAVLAIPMLSGAMAAPAESANEVKRAACSFEVKYVKSWVESGLDRYRMQLITNPREDRLLKVYCDLYTGTVGFTINDQCFWGDDYYLDSSGARGSAGHKAILDAHNKACDDFEVVTGCRTIRHF
ncbi:uncharacterized protein FIESC28_05936 [Fusarium coffeatum]|uniref:Ecp2 effector protein domain-containing protein n=1 Tax=Fusarium coffeatum TaxID=231269 RepID=A0A366RNH5_9HYPO|nr:uncharacterized protein FIESC28_05936 [Fusarium coffeatum]RBR18659.1 hypothetical protein FIESC28_05936 [Fusarium coffeatum]